MKSYRQLKKQANSDEYLYDQFRDALFENYSKDQLMNKDDLSEFINDIAWREFPGEYSEQELDEIEERFWKEMQG